MPRERITACLIVQDEQEHLPAALASVAFCDEIVVVDGGSSDRTLEIARAAGAMVIENPWPGYSIQRNVALDAAGSEWVIEVDADERVSPQLGASIQALLAAPPPGVALALCPLRHHFLGRPLGPSAKYPAYRSRIFRPAVYRHDERREVHEGVSPRERPVVLEGDLEHELASGVGEALRDMLGYARLESRHVTPPAARGYVTGIVARPLAKLLYRTIVDGGWRDGWRGMFKIALDVVSDALVWVLVLVRRQPAVPSRDVAPAAGGGALPQSNGAVPEHFGRRRVGQPKVLALAARGRSARAAREWLSALRARGIDVVLVSDEPAGGGGSSGSGGGSSDDGRGGGGGGDGGSSSSGSGGGDGGGDGGSGRGDGGGGDIPLSTVASFRPLAIMRAIDLETQVRELDALVAFGARARLMRRLLPPTLRPQVPGLCPGDDLDLSVELVQQHLTEPAAR